MPIGAQAGKSGSMVRGVGASTDPGGENSPALRAAITLSSGSSRSGCWIPVMSLESWTVCVGCSCPTNARAAWWSGPRFGERRCGNKFQVVATGRTGAIIRGAAGRERPGEGGEVRGASRQLVTTESFERDCLRASGKRLLRTPQRQQVGRSCDHEAPGAAVPVYGCFQRGEQRGDALDLIDRKKSLWVLCGEPIGVDLGGLWINGVVQAHQTCFTTAHKLLHGVVLPTCLAPLMTVIGVSASVSSARGAAFRRIRSVVMHPP